MPTKNTTPAALADSAEIAADLGRRSAEIIMSGATDEATLDELKRLAKAITLITTGRPAADAKVEKARAVYEARVAERDSIDDEIEAVDKRWKRVRA